MLIASVRQPSQFLFETGDNLRKATAHLFRNLAWKADRSSKQVLADSDVVTVLVGAAMDVSSRAASAQGKEVSAASAEPALTVILSALWNLSAHCRKNKVDSTSVKITREVYKFSSYLQSCLP